MNLAQRLGRTRWTHGLFGSLATLAAIGFACLPAQLAPTPGLVEFSELARVPVPGGHVNAAGGNYFHQGATLSIDTRLGEYSLGAVYNSGWGWTFGVDASYKNGNLRDASGAKIPLASIANGAAAPGTHWVKLDATRVKTKGGLVHEFDAATGRLAAMYWSSAAYPRLQFVPVQLGAVTRTARVEQCTSASACTLTFALTHDSSGRIVRVDDRAGRSALFTYDADGKLASSRDGLDVAKAWPGERYEYAGNFLAAIVNSEGERTEIASDASGRATEVRAVGAGDPAWRFGYGFVGVTSLATTTVVDPLGNATAFSIDTLSRVQSITNPLGERTTLTWAGQRPASRTLPDGAATLWTWQDDDVATETLPSGNVRRFSYQANGVNRDRPNARALAELSDSLGLVERRAYDAQGRLTSVANGANELTAFAYAADESVAGVTQPDGSSLSLRQYGEHGHPAYAVPANGSDGAVTARDAVGNSIATTIPDPQAGGARTREFDADRNLAALEVWDAPVAGATATGHRIEIERRSDGQIARVIRPYGGLSTFRYDAAGRLVAMEEQVSATGSPAPGSVAITTITRDLLGRAVALTLPNGMREEVVYDAAGRAVRRRTLRGSAVESDVTFDFSSGRLTRAHDSSALDETYEFDSAGRVRTIEYSDGEQLHFQYDERSRPTATMFLMPGSAPLATFSYSYDLADRETRVSFLQTPWITRRFVSGRLEETTYGNGIVDRSYRNASTGRASGRELWRGSKRVAKSDWTIASAPGGEVTEIRTDVDDNAGADGVSVETFGYGSFLETRILGRRLLSSTSGTASVAVPETLAYDALSNRTAAYGSTFEYNAERNRLLAVHTTPAPYVTTSMTYAYDPAGFVTRESETAYGATVRENSFLWSARGRIVAILADGTVAASFSYDALGRRLAQVANSQTTRWRFGGLVEADAAGQPVAFELGETRLALSGQHLVRHDDARGNPKLVTNAAGRVVRQNRFRAYSDAGALGNAADNVGFARGTPIVAGASVYALVGARLYLPHAARFLSPDPIWNAVNAYGYTLGNPVDFVDFSGLHAGRHHDLWQARIGFGIKYALYVGAIVALSTATAPALVVAASIGVVVAGLSVIDAMIELDQRSLEHRDQTENERLRREGESRGAPGRPLGGGGVGGEGGGRPGRTQVCSEDSFGVFCTRRISGGLGSPVFNWL